MGAEPGSTPSPNPAANRRCRSRESTASSTSRSPTAFTPSLNQIYVVTQFNSASLHRHIANTYKFDAFGRGFVEILAAQQTMENETWYQGTADAVRRNINVVLRPGRSIWS